MRKEFQKFLLIYLWLIIIMHNMLVTAAKTYYSDPCYTKSQQGICKTWAECPYIKTLLESGVYNIQEVERCGFEGSGIDGEVICCPLDRSSTKTSQNPRERTSTSHNTTIRESPTDVLTTLKPDFWLDLLKSTTTEQTIVKPSIEGNLNLKPHLEYNEWSLSEKEVSDTVTLPYDVSKDLKQTHEAVKECNTSNNNTKNNLDEVIRDIFIIGPNLNFPTMTNENPPNTIQLNRESLSNNESNSSVVRFNTINQVNPEQEVDSLQTQSVEASAKNMNNFSNFPKQTLPQHIQSSTYTNGNILNGQILIIKKEQSVEVFNPAANQQYTKIPQQQFFSPSSWQSIAHQKQAPYNTQQPSVQNPILQDSGHLDQLRPFHQTPQLSQPHPEYGTLQINNNPKQTPLYDRQGLLPQADLMNGAILNQINFNSQISPNLQIPTYVPINNGMLQQMSFDPQQTQTTTFSHNTPTNNAFLGPPTLQQSTTNSKIIIAPFQQQQLPVIYQNPQPDRGHNNYGEWQITSPVLPPNNTVFQQQQQQILPQTLQHQVEHNPVTTNHFIDIASVDNNRNQQSPYDKLLNLSDGKIKNVWKVIKNEQEQQQQNHEVGKFAKLQSLPSVMEFHDETTEHPTTTRPTQPTSPTRAMNRLRPAVQACKVLDEGLIPSLTPHIIGGIPAELGEFPHMAAIGFSRSVDDETGPYELKCGGTLISSRFVLTAAHCVSRLLPRIVRLGVVNFTDTEQMKSAVELKIIKTIIHDNYSISATYNDVALLELERQVEFTENIYPTCLYTNVSDPLPSSVLYVTGWGQVETTKQTLSQILLKAQLEITPLQRCNNSFIAQGLLPRPLSKGVTKILLCAYANLKDACQGDSGGPLNLVIDASYHKYRVVGIVASGFGCASTTPGIYTRVAEFLDFIEKHVWPNGQYDTVAVQRFKDSQMRTTMNL